MNQGPSETESRLSSELIERDRRHLADHVGLSVMGQCAAFVAGLGCMVLTTRLLGPAGYGRLELFFMFVAVLSQVVVGWANLGLVRFGREEFGRRRSLAESFGARIVLLAASLGAAGALLFGLKGLLDSYLGLSFAPHLLLLAYVALNESFVMIGRVFQIIGNFRAYAASAFGLQALKFVFVLLVFVILGWQASIAGVIGVQLVAIAVVLGVCSLVLPSRGLLPFRPRPAALRRLFRYSWPLMLGGLSVLVVDWVDLSVIRHFRSVEEVGWYAVSYRPVIIVTHLRIAFIGAVLPLVVSLAVERRHDSLNWFLDEALPQVAWVMGALCIVGAGAMEAIPLVLGGDYRPSVVPCQVLMAGMGFSVIAALLAALLRAMDRVRPTVVVGMVLAALNLLLDLALVPRLGIIGAAAATTISFAVAGILCFPIVNAVQHLRGSAPGRRYATLFGLAGPLVFAGCAVSLPRTSWRLAACAAILAGSALSARAIGVFRASTLEKLEDLAMPVFVRTLTRWFYRTIGR